MITIFLFRDFEVFMNFNLLDEVYIWHIQGACSGVRGTSYSKSSANAAINPVSNSFFLDILTTC